MKTFKFTCKQNQVSQVAILLGTFGKPHIEIKNGFPVVTVKHNTSNRKVNSFLFDNGVAGATKKKNLKVVKCERWELPYGKTSPKEWFVWAFNGKLTKVYYTYQTYCECCGPELDVCTKRNGKVVRV